MQDAVAGHEPWNCVPARMLSGTSSRDTSSNPSRSARSRTVVVRIPHAVEAPDPGTG